MKGLYGERRSRVRFLLELTGTVVGSFDSHVNAPLSVRVRDLSFNGALLELPHKVHLGKEIALEVFFPPGAKLEGPVRMDGTVTRYGKTSGSSPQFCVGIRLKAVPDGLKEALTYLLPRRAENLTYIERNATLGA